jgi:O-acetylhomoserine/O-acetylserine sulfhydrylase-like pyridoxal-dependent enzyme
VSNPTLEVIDLEAVAGIAHAVGATVIVDNVFATPIFSRALSLGADVVVYSTTKHVDGQGRALGGVILGTNGVHPQDGGALPQAHRRGDEPVHRLDHAQGDGDARPARAGAGGGRARDRVRARRATPGLRG